MSFAAISVKADEFASFDEVLDLIRGFESGALPRTRWTHKAHLTVACWYLICYPEPEATWRIRVGIQSYNQAQGVPTTKDRGYHETITLFWVRMIRQYLNKATLECALVYLINDLLEHYADGKLPFEYYSRDRLMSWEARTGYVEPDLKTLP
jgi:hypothetical protein